MTVTVKLRSSDGEILEVETNAIRKSSVISSMLDDWGVDDASDEVNHVFSLSKVSGTALRKVIEWCSHHKNDQPAEAKEENNKNKVATLPWIFSPWDTDFLKMDSKSLYDLVNVSHILDVKELTDLTCKAVANQMKGKKAEGIRQMFNIENDFTPQEEAQLRKDIRKQLNEQRKLRLESRRKRH